VFQEHKRYLTSLPIMVAPEPGEPLLLYIVATADVISMLLFAECTEPRQHQEQKLRGQTGPNNRSPPPALEPCDGYNTITESKLSKKPSGHFLGLICDE
jgi:hypothetical protein